jgi:hypothetical protein
MKGFYLFMLLCFAQAAAVARSNTGFMQAAYSATASDTSYRIIPSEANTYGYEILVNNNLVIRQQNIPGLPGNKGFATKADAAKTAQLVIQKLQQGAMPPTITIRELERLGIKL